MKHPPHGVIGEARAQDPGRGGRQRRNGAVAIVGITAGRNIDRRQRPVGIVMQVFTLVGRISRLNIMGEDIQDSREISALSP